VILLGVRGNRDPDLPKLNDANLSWTAVVVAGSIIRIYLDRLVVDLEILC
jgi:hypothetical protein